MKDRIVVTIRMGAFERDMELPGKMPMGELYEKLLGSLKSMNQYLFGAMDELVLSYQGAYLLKRNATLSELEITDGAYLDVVRSEKCDGSVF